MEKLIGDALAKHKKISASAIIISLIALAAVVALAMQVWNAT